MHAFKHPATSGPRGLHPHTLPEYTAVKKARHRLRELAAGIESVATFMAAAREDLVRLNVAKLLWEKAFNPTAHCHGSAASITHH